MSFNFMKEDVFVPDRPTPSYMDEEEPTGEKWETEAFENFCDIYTNEIDFLIEAKQSTKKLMEDKNHDYGEAWRDMRVSSLTDLILQKLLRVKQIEDNAGKTLVSEGIDANYQDMINYAVFSMIHLNEK